MRRSEGQIVTAQHSPMAFVLINADLGAEEDLVRELKNIEHVKEVYVVYGVYDIVAKIQADTMEKVKETITWKIRRLEKVRSTLTMIVVESES
jgi:DNA-binding Lrp family transcriptional regulator